MALTAKQERFAQNVALKGMAQNAAYAEAYDASAMAPATIDSRASELAANSAVAARIQVLKERATAAAVKKAAITLEDSLNEAGEMLDGAKAAGQFSAGVAAAKLRAQLAGHLVEKREVTTTDLDAADVREVLAIRDELRERLRLANEAAALLGEASAQVVAVAQPVRRVIG